MYEGDGSSTKTLGKSRFHCQNNWSGWPVLTNGKRPKYLKSSVRGPECPLNASFGRDMHFEKERIDLKGWHWTKQHKGKHKFGRLSSVNEKEMIFILANGCRLRRELVTI